jgi:hypothetical protein
MVECLPSKCEALGYFYILELEIEGVRKPRKRILVCSEDALCFLTVEIHKIQNSPLFSILRSLKGGVSHGYEVLNVPFFFFFNLFWRHWSLNSGLHSTELQLVYSGARPCPALAFPVSRLCLTNLFLLLPSHTDWRSELCQVLCLRSLWRQGLCS